MKIFDKHRLYSLAVLAAMALGIATLAKAETTECIVITNVPYTITEQGVYCFKNDLVTSMASGAAIEIATNNVTIDLNGWKLGGQGAGLGTQATGISASNRNNLTIRNGTIRGFREAIVLTGNEDTNGGHIVEDVRTDSNTYRGIVIKAKNSIVRRNQIVNTGKSDSSYGIVMSGSSNTIRLNQIASTKSEKYSAYGMFLSGVGFDIIDNTVDDTQGQIAKGVFISDGVEMVARGNRIKGTIGQGDGSFVASSVGMEHQTQNGVIFIDNVVINQAYQGIIQVGSIGIKGRAIGGLKTLCIENVVRNFETGIADCEDGGGNVVSPDY